MAMDKMLKKGLNRKRKLKIGYFVACLFGAKYKWNFLRKNKVFAYLGDNVLFQPNMLPNDPQYIKLHENVQVATGVTFFNHDVINTVFSKMHTSEKDVLATHIECIEVMENCFIGGNSTIVGGVKIDPNAIVAAGSVVVKDVPEGTVVGGNPARVIGNFWDIKEKRESSEKVFSDYPQFWSYMYKHEDQRIEEKWAEFQNKHKNDASREQII